VYHEVIQGHAEVRAIFKAGKRSIAGCSVTDGVVHRRDRVRVMRAGQKIWEGGIDSLKRFKDDAAEVREGFECGIALDGTDDLEVGDVFEFFASERV
jgi:translation initiation factor IF-2